MYKTETEVGGLSLVEIAKDYRSNTNKFYKHIISLMDEIMSCPIAERKDKNDVAEEIVLCHKLMYELLESEDDMGAAVGVSRSLDHKKNYFIHQNILTWDDIIRLNEFEMETNIPRDNVEIINSMLENICDPIQILIPSNLDLTPGKYPVKQPQGPYLSESSGVFSGLDDVIGLMRESPKIEKNARKLFDYLGIPFPSRN